jgi:hypothetical protein
MSPAEFAAKAVEDKPDIVKLSGLITVSFELIKEMVSVNGGTCAACNARMLVELKRDLGFESQACAFKNDFWTEFVSHTGSITKLTIDVISCRLLSWT